MNPFPQNGLKGAPAYSLAKIQYHTFIRTNILT